MKKSFVVFVLGGLLMVLLSSIPEMPPMGNVNNPSFNQVSEYYISQAIADTNTPNVIASIITDYRAFDTLGETTVLFTSITAVISVLSGKKMTSIMKREDSNE